MLRIRYRLSLLLPDGCEFPERPKIKGLRRVFPANNDTQGKIEAIVSERRIMKIAPAYCAGNGK